MKKLIGIFGFLFFIICPIFLYYKINILFQPSQFIICVIPPFLLSWAFTPSGTLLMILKALFIGVGSITEIQLKNIRKGINIFGIVALNSGIIASLLHFSISLSTNFCDNYGFKYYLASSFIGTCYGLFLYIISRVLEKSLE